MAQDIRVKLDELVRTFGGELIGAADVALTGVGTLTGAGPSEITFLSNSKYRSLLPDTRAGAVILHTQDQDATALPRIVTDNPYAYMAKVMAFFHPPQRPAAGIHATAMVDVTATVAPDAAIGPYVVIGKQATIGARAAIGAGCHIGAATRIGEDTVLYPGVTVYHACLLGARGIYHSGVVIGADGFGIAQEQGRWHKVPQVGGVVIGDDVEVGANTTIDRGALDDTVIEDGVKLDNQIQVAHNVRIGAHTAIAGCVGIAGSAVIGRHCMIGGAAMILGHLHIADGTTISTGTLVTKSIDTPGTYSAMWAAMPHREWLKGVAQLRRMEELARRVRELEEKIQALERKSP